MARLEYFIVCESASVDAATNKISLFNILEDIFPEEFPDDLRRVDAVALWHLDPEEERIDYHVTIRVTPPGLPVVDFPMNLSRGRLKYRAVVGIGHIPLQAPGELVFEVQLNGTHQAYHNVTIHMVGTLPFWQELPTTTNPGNP